MKVIIAMIALAFATQALAAAPSKKQAKNSGQVCRDIKQADRKGMNRVPRLIIGIAP